MVQELNKLNAISSPQAVATSIGAGVTAEGTAATIRVTAQGTCYGALAGTKQTWG